eukprot:GEMP01091188.1.p1 GENE.GEMP01091188.1~~GEMP01091188.1.p1  ORF type:complete len:103 (+),score=28.54 GEMP01091188.1:87-395(+)
MGHRYVGERWACRLCGQKKNTEDMGKCVTCGRVQGHDPVGYRARREELRNMDPYRANDEGLDDDSWSDWGIFFTGIILLVLVAGVVGWALVQDANGHDPDEL